MSINLKGGAQAESVIAASNLRKAFGDVQAVNDLSFSVEAGRVVGLLGPNGAGKTTTVNMLATLVPIDSGSASIGGFDVQRQPDQVRQLIGLAGQSAAVDEKLTARENLELFGRLYKIPRSQRRRRSDELIEQFDMVDFADRVVNSYSGGQRRRLDVVAALVANPRALFLDEPTTGLDPRSRAALWSTIAELANGGTAIVLTTQYLDEADRLADEVLIIDRGTAIASGTPESLKRNLQADVLEVHVGDGELSQAVACLASLDGFTVNEKERSISVPVGGDAGDSLEVLQRLQAWSISIVDFQLRRPTLDDVFLDLTGETTRPETVPA